MAILTDKPAATVVALSDLIHIVDTSDTTENPLGSSKKASIQQIKDLISSTIDTFTELTDTPADYTGAALKGVRVNAGATGLEFYNITPGVTTYVGLSDTPGTFTNGYFVTMNGSALVHTNPASYGLSNFNNDLGFITSNLTHTGEVTGAASLTVNPTAISNKTLITAGGTMELLVNDGGTLKKVVASDFLAGGADGNGIYDGSGTLIGNTTVSLGGFGLGIGTAPVAGKALTVGGDFQVDGEALIDSNVGIGSFGSGAGFAHSSKLDSTNYAIWQSSAGATYLNTSAGQTLFFQKANTTQMTLNASGDLIVNNNIDCNGTIDGGAVRIGTIGGGACASSTGNFNSTDYALFQETTGETYVNSKSGFDLSLRINNSDKLVIKSTGVTNFTPLTAAEASAVTPSNGDFIYVSSTNGTFTSVGFWGYEGGTWVKL